MRFTIFTGVLAGLLAFGCARSQPPVKQMADAKAAVKAASEIGVEEVPEARLRLKIANERLAREGQQTKMELVYEYLTGPRFRHRVEAIVEKFSDMQADLDKERKTTMRLWAKREAQIQGVIDSTVGMYGDLQGIAGRALQEIEGLDAQLIEDQSHENNPG